MPVSVNLPQRFCRELKNLGTTPFSLWQSPNIHITAVSAITSATFSRFRQDLALPTILRNWSTWRTEWDCASSLTLFTLTPPKTKSKVWAILLAIRHNISSQQIIQNGIRDYSITASQKFCIFWQVIVAGGWTNITLTDLGSMA